VLQPLDIRWNNYEIFGQLRTRLKHWNLHFTWSCNLQRQEGSQCRMGLRRGPSCRSTHSLLLLVLPLVLGFHARGRPTVGLELQWCSMSQWTPASGGLGRRQNLQSATSPPAHNQRVPPEQNPVFWRRGGGSWIRRSMGRCCLVDRAGGMRG
jgi:hypothetical protein